MLNVADATTHLARWRRRLSEFDFDVVYRADIKHLTAYVSFYLQTTRADTDSIKAYLSVATIDTETTKSTKLHLEKHQRAIVQVVENNKSL